MSTAGYAFIAAVFVGAGVAVGWWVTEKNADAEIAQMKADQAIALKVISDKAAQDTAAAIEKMKRAQSDLVALDQSSQEKLENAQKENDDLRDDIIAGRRRVQFAQANYATCKRSQSAVSGASGMGDATGVELSSEAGQNILDIRAGIINDQAKLSYLQNYITVLQKSGVIAAPSNQETTK